jgi:ketosteroid isomerase-like protein
MKSFIVFTALAFACGSVLAADAPPAPPAPPPPKMSAAECEVWNRERSFARSVDEHDTAAFTAHLHPQAVFFGGPGQIVRGSEEVTKGWAGIISGEVPLHWYPRQVVIGGDPDIAHSTGPYWSEDTRPEAKARYVVGQFISIWRKVDGRWVVLYDGGGGGQAQPVSKEKFEAMKASLAPECPRA